MPIWLVAIASIALSVMAQFSLKAGMSGASIREALAQPFGAPTMLAFFRSPHIVGGFALYGLGAIIWLAVLSRWDVSKAYPLVGLGFALTLLIGFLSGEQISPQRVGGVFLICAGVWLVART